MRTVLWPPTCTLELYKYTCITHVSLIHVHWIHYHYSTSTIPQSRVMLLAGWCNALHTMTHLLEVFFADWTWGTDCGCCCCGWCWFCCLLVAGFLAGLLDDAFFLGFFFSSSWGWNRGSPSISSRAAFCFFLVDMLPPLVSAWSCWCTFITWEVWQTRSTQLRLLVIVSLSLSLSHSHTHTHTSFHLSLH